MGVQDNPADQSFPPGRRLHSNRDYGRVFHRQQKAAGRHTVVLVLPRHRKQPQESRVGIMVPAKAVKTAVRRHQLKRWVRELFRTRLGSVLAAHDCVVLFRNDPPADSHARLDEEIAGLVAKALQAQATPGVRGGRR